MSDETPLGKLHNEAVRVSAFLSQLADSLHDHNPMLAAVLAYQAGRLVAFTLTTERPEGGAS